MQGHKQLLLGTAFNILKCGSDIFESHYQSTLGQPIHREAEKGRTFLNNLWVMGQTWL